MGSDLSHASSFSLLLHLSPQVGFHAALICPWSQMALKHSSLPHRTATSQYNSVRAGPQVVSLRQVSLYTPCSCWLMSANIATYLAYIVQMQFSTLVLQMHEFLWSCSMALFFRISACLTQCSYLAQTQLSWQTLHIIILPFTLPCLPRPTCLLLPFYSSPP